ncbi:MAG: hypothetical protein WBF43_02480 [Methylocella sp.]
MRRAKLQRVAPQIVYDNLQQIGVSGSLTASGSLPSYDEPGSAQASNSGTAALGDLRAYGLDHRRSRPGFGVSALNMMALTPGKERRADEYKRLLERSCLRSILADFDFKIFERNVEIYAKRIDQDAYP